MRALMGFAACLFVFLLPIVSADESKLAAIVGMCQDLIAMAGGTQ